MQPAESGVPERRRVAKVGAVAAAADRLLAVVAAVVREVHVVARRRQVEERDEADAMLGHEPLLQPPPVEIQVGGRHAQRLARRDQWLASRPMARVTPKPTHDASARGG